MSESTPLTCSQCYKYFPNSLALSRHMHIHQQHIRTHTEHKSHSLVPRYNMDLSQLSSLMSQSSLYQKHKPYRCENCSECFADEAGLLEHIPKHKESKHICQYCGKDFHFSSLWSRHMRIHLGIKPFQCGICKRMFTQRGNLQGHMRIHLGLKRFQCEICKRTFGRQSNLKRHKLTHTLDKPYKCLAPGCDMAFTRLSSLQHHFNDHQTDEPYKCKRCPKCFADEKGLLEHILEHKDSDRPNKHYCQYCGKSYMLETFLAEHMMNNHRNLMVDRPLSLNPTSDNQSLGRPNDLYRESSYVHLTSPSTHHLPQQVSEPCLSTRLQHVDPRGSHQLQNERKGPLPEPMRNCEPPANLVDRYWKSSDIPRMSLLTPPMHPPMTDPCQYIAQIQYMNPIGSHQLRHEWQEPGAGPVRRHEPPTHPQESFLPPAAYSAVGVLRLTPPPSQEYQPFGLAPERSDHAHGEVPDHHEAKSHQQ